MLVSFRFFSRREARSEKREALSCPSHRDRDCMPIHLGLSNFQNRTLQKNYVTFMLVLLCTRICS